MMKINLAAHALSSLSPFTGRGWRALSGAKCEPGEGQKLAHAPHPVLASLGPPSPRKRGEGKNGEAV